jgi:hypothetical protein
MPKKSGRISAREFSIQFTKVVSRHLSALPPAEQDKHIKDAKRATMATSRVERPATRRVEEIQAIPLLSRTRFSQLTRSIQPS